MLKVSPPFDAAVMSELMSGLLGLLGPVASFWQAVREDITVASKTEQKARIGASEDQRLIPGMELLNEEDTASGHRGQTLKQGATIEAVQHLYSFSPGKCMDGSSSNESRNDVIGRAFAS